MLNTPVIVQNDAPPDAGAAAPRATVPAAFYRDDEPPEPPEDDPHWREFQLFDGISNSRLILVAIVLGAVFVTLAHLAVILFI